MRRLGAARPPSRRASSPFWLVLLLPPCGRPPTIFLPLFRCRRRWRGVARAGGYGCGATSRTSTSGAPASACAPLHPQTVWASVPPSRSRERKIRGRAPGFGGYMH